MVKLYGVARSRASRAMWLLGEIGMDYDHVPVIQAYRLANAGAPDAPFNTRSPDFLALSPAGAIPVLEDDGLVLSESVAINLYVAKKYGGPLGPRGAGEEALMLQWGLYGATAVEPAALAIMYAHAEGRAGTPEGEAELARHRETLRRPLAVLNGHLGVHGHLVGDRFTVADLNLAEMVRYAMAEPELIAGFPAVEAWIAQLHARPAFTAMWARRIAEPA